MNDTRAWTEDEDRDLRKLWREGRADRHIAAAIGRTRESTRSRRLRLGLPANTYRHTPEHREATRQANFRRHADPALHARMVAPLAVARASGAGRRCPRILPPEGTRELRNYKKIQALLGTPAARQALIEGRL